MKKFVLTTIVLVLLSVFIGGVAAQEGLKPAFLLYEDGQGNIFVAEVQLGNIYEISVNIQGYSTSPVWSHDGSSVAFVVPEDIPESQRDEKWGRIAIVHLPTMEVTFVDLCDRHRAECAMPWYGEEGHLSFTRRIDDGRVFKYVQSPEGEVFFVQRKRNGFDPYVEHTDWVDEQTIVLRGNFGGSPIGCRYVNIHTERHEDDQWCSRVHGYAWVGRNSEMALPRILGHAGIEVLWRPEGQRYNDVIFEADGLLARRNPWRPHPRRRPPPQE